jgi:Glycosyl hydrolase family 20, domain 2
MFQLKIRCSFSAALILIGFCHITVARGRIIPSPQFQRLGDGRLLLKMADEYRGLLLKSSSVSGKEKLAAQILMTEMKELAAGDWVITPSQPGDEKTHLGPRIYMVDWSVESRIKTKVNSWLDRDDLNILSIQGATGQAYVMRVSVADRRIVLVGYTGQGLLYAVSSFLQLVQREKEGVAIPEVHIRDWPDFKFRAASDWLLNAEINRWAYDYGDGKTAYVKRIKRKLDFLLRYKINMVFFDGFGWNNEKFPGYSHMMRELNRYARERGVKLIFAGYGANFRAAAIRPEHNIGKVWYNQESYSQDYIRGEPFFQKIYACFGENNSLGPYLGTCRGNDELNRLKAQEMEDFVRSVEPGAIYIHHEDRGVSAPDGELAETWKRRCPRCRKKWPNDDVLAMDGGAGAVAHGYNNLLQAVFKVKNDATGYDGSRDCEVLLTSPAYGPFDNIPQNWEDHLEFWSNVGASLVRSENVQITFRENFPQEGTGKRWVDAYQERMLAKGNNPNMFLFFLGGADFYSNPSGMYPFIGTPAMNGIFKGAKSIYNFSGAVHQEPLQLLNSEFSWNTHAPGYQIPEDHATARKLFKELSKGQEAFDGPNGFLAIACEKLYGKKPGQAMFRYFTFYKSQPLTDSGLDQTVLAPSLPLRLYPLSTPGMILEAEANYWKASQDYLLTKKSPEERLRQERLSQVWQLWAEVNAKALSFVHEAQFGLSLRWASENTEESRLMALQDVSYLQKCLSVGKHFSETLAAYHRLLAQYGQSAAESEILLGEAKRKLNYLSEHLADNFSFDTVDPLGGEQATWRAAELGLRNQLIQFERGLSKYSSAGSGRRQ